MAEPTTPWDFVTRAAPNLIVISAEVILWNGGSIFATEFVTQNREGIDQHLTFESTRDWGLECPGDVKECRIDLVKVKVPGKKKKKKGLSIRINSPQRRDNDGVEGWPEHRDMLINYFGKAFAEAAGLDLLRKEKLLLTKANENDTRFLSHNRLGGA
jgi:hypothetical protein